jgi:cell division protein ZapA
MPRVEVALNGRYYGLACADGQEGRLRELAAYVDMRLRDVAAAGPGNEAQLLVLTALTLADEIFEQQAALAQARIPRADAPTPANDEAGTLVELVERLTRRVEDIASRLERA